MEPSQFSWVIAAYLITAFCYGSLLVSTMLDRSKKRKTWERLKPKEEE